MVEPMVYSTAIKQKYQGYFITEASVEINGQALKPGALASSCEAPMTGSKVPFHHDDSDAR